MIEKKCGTQNLHHFHNCRMRHPDLFDFSRRMDELSEHGDPLEKLAKIIPWEHFRKTLKKVVNKEEGKPGRPPYDVVMMFKILMLQRLYDLSDEQTEFQIRDRLTFMRFLGLDLHSEVPDENTIRNFREKLKEKGLVHKLFKEFNQVLESKGLISRQGSIIDATIVEVPKQRNTVKENEVIKSGSVPEGWIDNSPKMSQKDTDARWLSYRGVHYFGYKNHTRVDVGSKIIQDYEVSPASVHDSRLAPVLLKKIKGKLKVYADSAYNSPEISKILKKKCLVNRICSKGYRNRPLTNRDISKNESYSRKRCRIEHVYGDMKKFGGDFIRSIGKNRAESNIGLINLTYNIRRYVFLAG